MISGSSIRSCLAAVSALAICALVQASMPARAADADVIYYPHHCSDVGQWVQPPSVTRAETPPATTEEGHFAELLQYICSGDYMRDITNRIDEARAYIAFRTRWSTPDENLAIVLDIDETSLTNEPEILAGEFRKPASKPDDPCDDLEKGCGYNTWEAHYTDDAILPTLELFREAKAAHITIFFVTGRTVEMRANTAANLKHADYDGYKCLFLKPDKGTSADPAACPDVPFKYTANSDSLAAYKHAARKAISDAGYTIIANIGDQQSDLSDPSDSGGEPSEASFLLPNPFY